MIIAEIFGGKAISGFGEIIMVLLLSVSTLSFSQIKINTVREGYYKIFDADSTQINQKATELEAMQGLANYQFKTGKVGFYTPPNFRIDISHKKRIDTINISRRIDVDGFPVRAFRDMVVGGYYYVLFIDEGMIKFITDSLPRDKIKYRFERVIEIGKTSYKQIDNTPPAMGTIITIE